MSKHAQQEETQPTTSIHKITPRKLISRSFTALTYATAARTRSPVSLIVDHNETRWQPSSRAKTQHRSVWPHCSKCDSASANDFAYTLFQSAQNFAMYLRFSICCPSSARPFLAYFGHDGGWMVEEALMFFPAFRHGTRQAASNAEARPTNTAANGSRLCQVSLLSLRNAVRCRFARSSRQCCFIRSCACCFVVFVVGLAVAAGLLLYSSSAK